MRPTTETAPLAERLLAAIEEDRAAGIDSRSTKSAHYRAYWGFIRETEPTAKVPR